MEVVEVVLDRVVDEVEVEEVVVVLVTVGEVGCLVNKSK